MDTKQPKFEQARFNTYFVSIFDEAKNMLRGFSPKTQKVIASVLDVYEVSPDDLREAAENINTMTSDPYDSSSMQARELLQLLAKGLGKMADDPEPGLDPSPYLLDKPDSK